jgi:tetratricopeptide (TPR) repeat protein
MESGRPVEKIAPPDFLPSECYYWRMLSRFLAAAAALLMAVTPVFPQSTTNVTFTRDLRLFAMMGALNAAGFDIEFGSQYHPVREALRKYSADVDPELVKQLKAFYKNHKGDQTDEAQLAKYISLAVNLSEIPDFQPALREELMPPDARSVFDFAELMREYYEKAHLGRHWLEVRADYERAIEQIGPVLRELFVRTDSYLRIPLGANTGRSMSVYLELAAPINTVNLRSNQESYYVILGDSASPKIDDIRHAYLHFQMDTLVTSNMSRLQGVPVLLDLVKKANGVDPAYTAEGHTMTAESLIRALELRMDKVPPARARESINAFYRSGLILTPYFYEALEGFERGDLTFRFAFIDMARNLDEKSEEKRFRDTFNKIPVPQKSVARPEVPQEILEPTNPALDLLKQAQIAFNAGDVDRARTAFERVLADYDRDNGAAEYGLGLIASKKGDSQEAKEYFDKAIRNGSVEPGMKVWSYIYMARIFDLECSRDRALEYYQQAIKMGDNSQNAQAAAKDGVAKPYGGGETCK